MKNTKSSPIRTGAEQVPLQVTQQAVTQGADSTLRSGPGGLTDAQASFCRMGRNQLMKSLEQRTTGREKGSCKSFEAGTWLDHLMDIKKAAF